MAGTSIATAYIQLVPSVVGLQGAIQKELAPAAGLAGKAGTSSGQAYSSNFGSGVKGADGHVTSALAPTTGTAGKAGTSSGQAYSNNFGGGVKGTGTHATNAIANVPTQAGQIGQKSGDQFSSAFGGGLMSMAKTAGLAFAAMGIASFIGDGIKSAMNLEVAMAKTTTAIKATGGAANVTEGDITKLAGSLNAQTATSKGAIREGANLLLTFKNISNQAGAGNDIFNQTSAAMVDMARFMGTDTTTAAMQLGKALNDPIAGMGALARVGVQFSESQKTTIASLVQSGDLLGAQKIILAELNSQFGGAGAGYAETMAGQLDLFNQAMGRVGAQIGSALLPAIKGVASLVSSTLIPAFGLLGEGAKGVIGGFFALPAPIQAAAFAMGAFALLRGPMVSMFETVALKAMYLWDSIKNMASGFKTGVSSLSGFNTAMSSLMSSIGPGLIAGLGVAAIVAVVGYFQKVSAAATQAKSDLQGVVDALVASNGVVNAATKTAADNALVNSKAFKELVADGLSGSEAITALTGSAAEWTNITGSAGTGTNNLNADTILLVNAYREANGQVPLLSQAQIEANRILAESSPVTQQAATDALAAARQTTEWKTALSTLNSMVSGSIDPTSAMAAAVAELNKQEGYADTAGQFLWLTLQKLQGNAVSMEQTTRAQAAAVRDHAQAIQDQADKQAAYDYAVAHLGETINGELITDQTVAAARRDLDDAGDGVYDSNVKMAQSSIDLAAAQYEQDIKTVGVTEATRLMNERIAAARAEFIATQPEAARTSGEADRLADSMGLIPRDVTTSMNTVNAAQVQADAQKIQDTINAIPEEQRTSFVQENLGGPNGLKAQVDALNQKMIDMGNTNYHFTINGTSIIKEYAPNSLSVGTLAALHQAAGGLLSGPGTGTSDSIAMWGSTGEFMVNAAATAKWLPFLTAINAGKMARGGLIGYADGGVVAAAATATDPSTVPAPALAPAPGMIPDAAAINTAWAAVVASVAAAWAAILPTFDLFDLRTIQLGTEWTTLATVDAVPLWTLIGATIAGTWNGVIAPTYAALNAGTVGVAGTWQWLLNSNVVPVFAGINATVSGSWGGVIYPTYSQLNAGTANVGASWQNLAVTTATTWGQIGSSISSAYTLQIVPAWTGVQGFATSTGTFFAGIASGMDLAKTTTLGDLQEIRTKIDEFFVMVDAKTVVASAPALADGGLITSGTGPRSDDVGILVSKGEYVVNAAATAQNLGTLNSMNYGYADGGLIGDKVGSHTSAAITSGVQRAIEAGVVKVLASIAASGGSYIPGSGVGLRGAFLDAVNSKMGSTYEWGATGPVTFDCSGLMVWALQQAGVPNGARTAQDFNAGYPHVPTGQPGDLVTFDTGRLPGQAGHIGAIMDVDKGLMMHTDGAGPARVGDYKSRDGGPLSILDVIGGTYTTTAAAGDAAGDPPSGGWLGKVLTRIKAGGTGTPTAVAYDSGGGWEQWRSTVLQALSMIGQPADLADTVLNQIRTESSGNPNAINLTDSNARAGHPSQGLIQAIPSTFAAYALPGYNTNIVDPLSNIIAGIRYAIDRYGSIKAGMRGVAYDSGGWLQPGGTAINLRRQPEAVLTPDHWATAAQAIDLASQGGGRPGVTFSGDIHMGSGGPQDLFDEAIWRARAMVG